MTREQCDLLSAPLVRTVNDMEDEILRVIAAQLAKDGNISDTSKWRIRQLARSGEMDKETAKIIAKYSGLEESFAMAAIEDAAKIEMSYVDNAVRAEGLAALAMGGEASAEASAMGAYAALQRQAKSSLNLVNTVMMYKAKQTFVNGVNKIYYESEKSRQDALNTMGKYSAGTVMGQFSLQEATRRCIKEMAGKGIPAFVDKRGREWSPEAYVMMDMRSTLGNTARAAQWARCDEYGIKLIEVSSHLGARPGCAPYQGRIFSRDGSSGTTTDGAGNKITYTPLSQTSYGKPDGLFGINCGHVQYPFFPGCSFQSYFPYPKEENAEMYKNHQKQRYYERQIRAAKRECVMLNETGDAEGFKAAAARLKRSKESYRKFTESKGLYLHNDRTQVVGFDRSVSGKATWANRKAEQAKASAAAVKAGGVSTGGKGSSGGHAVTVTPPRDPIVGNSATIYRDTKYLKGSSIQFGKIDREKPISKALAQEYSNEYERLSKLFGIDSKVSSIDVMAYQNNGIWGGFNPYSKSIILRGVGGDNGKSNMIKIAQEHKKSGEWSTSSYLHTFRHEMGHAIQEEMKANDPLYADKLEKIKEIRNSFFKGLTEEQKNDIINVKKNALSLYGLIDNDDYEIGEFISECIAEYANGKPRKLAKDTVQILIGADGNAG